jgi:hypothetical protein
MSSNAIAELNDKFRRNPYNGLGRFFVTRGVHDLGKGFVQKCIAAVKTFDNFTKENDPYGEHDFFSVEVDGVQIFWKCDYYDHSLKYGSPNPADIHVTTRIGTIMLAEEY